VLISVPDPYDFVLSTARFREYGSDGTTIWHEGGLHRVVAGREVRIEPARGGVRVEPAGTDVREEVAYLLGLPFDLDAFRAWAAGDEVLARVAATVPGFRPTLTPNPFEALVIAITAQQVSLRAAAAIRSRFVQRFGVRHELASAFPERGHVAGATIADLRALGFSERKAEYVLGLARSDLDLAGLAALSDTEVVDALTAVRGLGRWTADWFLARALARPAAWPAGDLGVRKAVAAFYADRRPLSIEEVRSMSERFAPFQNLSAQHLLAGLRIAG
jgi:DNA-3-methyladenine glycosylase II